MLAQARRAGLLVHEHRAPDPAARLAAYGAGWSCGAAGEPLGRADAPEGREPVLWAVHCRKDPVLWACCAGGWADGQRARSAASAAERRRLASVRAAVPPRGERGAT
jgi:hypothetical protein